MKIQTLQSGKDGSIPSLNPDTKYLVIELTDGVKVLDTGSPAKMGTVLRHVVTIEETSPLVVKAEAKTAKPLQAKPQGE